MASSVGVVGFLVLVAALLQCTTAQNQNHTVGDTTGWTIPPNSNFYPTWVNNQVFRVGDTLIFNFTTGAHDVLEVPRERHDSCSGTGAIGSIITTGPATVPLTSAGQHYFICTVGAHCSLGQRLSINVLSATTPTPTPTPTPPSGGTPPTPTPTPTPSAGTPPTPTPTPSAGTPPSPSPSPTPSAGTPPTPTPTPSAGTPPSPSPTPSAGTPPTPTPTPTTPSGGSPPTVPSADSPAPPPFVGGPPPPSSATSIAAGFGVAAVLSAISFFL